MIYKEPHIVAEICCNHQGDIKIAKKMIETAANGKATVAKFQKRNNKEFLTNKQYNSPHPNKMHSFGEPYGVHREFLEFTFAQHKELKCYAEQLGIMYSCSTFVGNLISKLFVLLTASTTRQTLIYTCQTEMPCMTAISYTEPPAKK